MGTLPQIHPAEPQAYSVPPLVVFRALKTALSISLLPDYFPRPLRPQISRSTARSKTRLSSRAYPIWTAGALLTCAGRVQKGWWSQCGGEFWLVYYHLSILLSRILRHTMVKLDVYGRGRPLRMAIMFTCQLAFVFFGIVLPHYLLQSFSMIVWEAQELTVSRLRSRRVLGDRGQ
jgi:hypothetical protein